MPVKDGTGGFKCFRRIVLESIDLNNIRSMATHSRLRWIIKHGKKGFKIIEIPITFVDRVHGTSKMSKKIVREAIFMVWKLRLKA